MAERAKEALHSSHMRCRKARLKALCLCLVKPCALIHSGRRERALGPSPAGLQDGAFRRLLTWAPRADTGPAVMP